MLILPLLLRCRIFIALFGAVLANCRLLPPGAIVVQITGALKGEIGEASTWSQYANLCGPERGLRWVAFAVPGWRQRYPEDAGSPDLMTARVLPAPFAEFVARAIHALTNESEYDSLRSEYSQSLAGKGKAKAKAGDAEAEAAKMLKGMTPAL